MTRTKETKATPPSKEQMRQGFRTARRTGTLTPKERRAAAQAAVPPERLRLRFQIPPRDSDKIEARTMAKPRDAKAMPRLAARAKANPTWKR